MKENATDRLEKKLDGLIEDVSYVKATLIEREKTEILRNEVITQAMKTQDTAIQNINLRVCKLEDGRDKIIWLVVSAVILAVIGTVIGVNVLS